MTKNNEQITLSLHLKSEEDLNEKIIKEKGNTKCIFYADDICRNGDKTRDCVNCARVEYHSLYSLNWDNQERLQKIIKHKEQECEELKEELKLEKDLNKDLLKEYWEEKKSLTDANARLIKGLMVHKEKYAELKKEIETLKKLPNEENCHFDKIKELVKEL